MKILLNSAAVGTLSEMVCRIVRDVAGIKLHARRKSSSTVALVHCLTLWAFSIRRGLQGMAPLHSVRRVGGGDPDINQPPPSGHPHTEHARGCDWRRDGTSCRCFSCRAVMPSHRDCARQSLAGDGDEDRIGLLFKYPPPRREGAICQSLKGGLSDDPISLLF